MIFFQKGITGWTYDVMGEIIHFGMWTHKRAFDACEGNTEVSTNEVACYHEVCYDIELSDIQIQKRILVLQVNSMINLI